MTLKNYLSTLIIFLFAIRSATSNNALVSHIFTNPGSHVTTLTVSDGIGNTDDATIAITVQNPPNPSSCEYLAYDGMDYGQNTALHGKNGGVGFQAAWHVQNDNTTIPGYQVANTTASLTYSNLQTEGRYLSGGRNYQVSGRRLNTLTTGPFANYVTSSNPAIGGDTQGDTLWVSTLIHKPTNDNDEVFVEWHSADLAWCNLCPNTQRIGLGYYGASSNVNGEKRWSLFVNGTTYPSTVPLTIGSTSLLVARMVFNPTNTVIDVFVNPTSLGNNSPGTPTLSHTSSSPQLIRSIGFYGGNTEGKGYIDELRMAAQYKCVAPDPSITFEVPPTAIITASPTSGMAPLTVMFDGSNSTNPAGGNLTYSWNFGDNSVNGSNAQETHTYTQGGGQATVTLTVTDINGNSHSASQVINLYNENGSFPCLSTVTALHHASCNNGGGEIRVNLENNTAAVLTLGSNVINPTSGTTYSNLNAGIYHLAITGTNGCTEDYDLTVPIDSSSCSGWQPAACAMAIGTNLPGFADWEPHRAMRNFMKNTRGEAIPYTNACNCWSFDEATIANIFSQMAFDTSGYPTHLPQTTSSGDILLRYFVSSQGRNMVAGQTYVLLYDGIGVIDPTGSLANVSSTSGRIQFDLVGDGTFWFQITQSTLGNHVRNIRVLRLADENQNITNQPFYSEFLNKIEPFSVLRFMDWQHTNNNPLVQWADRTKPSRFSYGDNRGVPYEVIVQLANQTQKDVWICVPHAADNNFILQMATLFKNQLDTNLTIYLEYSNEVWNWIFTQAQYNNNNRPFNLNYGRAAALKAKNVFDIWHTVFAGQECRVKRVLGIQAGFNYLNEQIIAHLDQDDWDYGSPTHYFGLDHETTGVPRLDLLGAAATVTDVMTNAMNSFLAFKETVKQDYRNIQVMGKKIITYEGGQHFVGNVFGVPYPYQQAMWDAQSSTQMYNMYNVMHDSIKKWGCELATNFSLAGPQESVYGSWGVMEHIDIQPPYMTTAPKYQALLDNLPDTTCFTTYTWQGDVSHLWSDRCNWDKNKIPNHESHVYIPANVPYHPKVNINGVAKSVFTAANAILEVLMGYRLDIGE